MHEAFEMQAVLRVSVSVSVQVLVRGRDDNFYKEDELNAHS